MRRSLEDWLTWQQSLHPRAIELGLDRVRAVSERLDLAPPPSRVFTIAGTNGKGTTAHYLAAIMAEYGWRVGMYTSPHLVRYNERVRMGGTLATDEELIASFECVEAARGDTPLTYFEFGTLAALWLFQRAALDAWVLEVGLGGRLDAVNVIDPDFSLITTVARDHEDWLGHSLEDIAAEKAGILRPGRPGYFGGADVPAAIRKHARVIGADLRLAGKDFGHARHGDSWRWWSAGGLRVEQLPLPAPGDEPQLANISLAIAAAAECLSALAAPDLLTAAVSMPPPPGRCQQLSLHERDWVLDVAHNPQAAAVLTDHLRGQTAPEATTVVIGLHVNKDLQTIVRSLAPLARRWIACRAGEQAGFEPAELAARLAPLVTGRVVWRDRPADALQLALELSDPGERILVCGSFEVVGPALEWLNRAPGSA